MYNGNVWTNYTSHLSPNNSLKNVFSIKIDKTRKIYICDGYNNISTGSIISFDGIKWNYIYQDGKDINTKNFIVDTLNHIWFLRDTATLCEFNGISWKNHTVPFHITSDNFYFHTIYADSLCNIWIGFNGNKVWYGASYPNNIGLLEFNGSNWESYDTTNSEIETNNISSLLFKNQTLYIGTAGKEINTLSNNNWNHLATSNSVLNSNKVKALEIDNSTKDVWLATEDQLMKVNSKNWENIDSVPLKHINSISIDYSKNIWIGGEDGLAVYNGKNWTKIDSIISGYPTSSIKSIAIDNKDNVWFLSIPSSKHELAVYDNKIWTFYIPDVPMGGYYNKIISDNKGNIWIGAYDDLITFDGNNFKSYGFTLDTSIIGTGNTEIYNLNFNNDLLWLATDHGLVKYDNSKFIQITSDYTFACGSDKNNNIWVYDMVTYDAGFELRCFDSTGKLLNTFTPSNSGFPYTVSYPSVIKISEDGWVFIATLGDGLVIYKKGNKVSINETDNVFANYISIFPNPCLDYFEIRNNSPYDESMCNIFDISGRLIKSKKIYKFDNFVDVSDLRNGIYLVILKNNSINQNFKLIKE